MPDLSNRPMEPQSDLEKAVDDLLSNGAVGVFGAMLADADKANQPDGKFRVNGRSLSCAGPVVGNATQAAMDGAVQKFLESGGIGVAGMAIAKINEAQQSDDKVHVNWNALGCVVAGPVGAVVQNQLTADVRAVTSPTSNRPPSR